MSLCFFLFLVLTFFFFFFISIPNVSAFTWNRPTIVEANLNVNSSEIWVTVEGNMDNVSDLYPTLDGRFLNLSGTNANQNIYLTDGTTDYNFTSEWLFPIKGIDFGDADNTKIYSRGGYGIFNDAADIHLGRLPDNALYLNYWNGGHVWIGRNTNRQLVTNWGNLTVIEGLYANSTLTVLNNSNFSGSLYPMDTLTYNVGAPDYRWNGIYAGFYSGDNANFSGDVNALGYVNASTYYGSGITLDGINISDSVINVTGDFTGYAMNTSYLFGAGGIGGIDMRGSPWWFSGADWYFDENVTINKNLYVGRNLSVDGNASFGDWVNITNLQVNGVTYIGSMDLSGGNITASNITATNYFYGQPLDGSIGSGILNSSSNLACGCIDVSDDGGLDVTYPDLKVKIWDLNGSTIYCDIPSASPTVPDNAHTVYYVDSDCNVQTTTWANYFAQDLNSSNYVRIFDIFTINGDIGILKGGAIIGITQRKSKFAKVNCGGGHLSICDGMYIIQSATFPEINMSSGHMSYINTVTTTQQRDSNPDGLHVTCYSDGSHTVETEIDVDKCDDGGACNACPDNKYRRYIIYNIGWGDHTKIHQLAPNDGDTYTTLANCINTVKNPLSYTLPDFEDGVANVLAFYCGRRDDTAWSNGLVDLRAGREGFGAVPDLAGFLRNDENINMNNYNASFDWVNANNLNVTGNTYIGAGFVFEGNLSLNNYNISDVDVLLVNRKIGIGNGAINPSSALYINLGEVNITGSNGVGNVAPPTNDAPDVLVAIGGKGGDGSIGGFGADIILIAGDGGDVTGADTGGGGGSIHLKAGSPGTTQTTTGTYGNIFIVEDGVGNVSIGSTNTPTQTLTIFGDLNVTGEVNSFKMGNNELITFGDAGGNIYGDDSFFIIDGNNKDFIMEKFLSFTIQTLPIPIEINGDVEISGVLDQTNITGDNGGAGSDAPSVLVVKGGTGGSVGGGTAGKGSDIEINSGTGGTSTLAGSTSGDGGDFNIILGDGGTAVSGGNGGDGGDFNLSAGDGGEKPDGPGSDGDGGNIYLRTGTRGDGGTNDGSVYIYPNDGGVFIGNSASNVNATLVTIYGNITASNFEDFTEGDDRTDDEALQSILSYESYTNKLSETKINHTKLSDFVRGKTPIWEDVYNKTECNEVSIMEEVCINIIDVNNCSYQIVNGKDYYEKVCYNKTKCSMQPKQSCSISKKEVCEYEKLSNGFYEKICSIQDVEECEIITEEKCEDIYEHKIIGYQDTRSLSNSITEIWKGIKALFIKTETIEDELCAKDGSYSWCGGTPEL